MPTGRQRLLQLALESLELRRSGVEQEIARLRAEMNAGRKAREVAAPAAVVETLRKKPRISKAERARRSARLKAYWAVKKGTKE